MPYRTLFHDLVDSCTIDVRHFIEFVNADHTAVGQNHGAGF